MVENNIVDKLIAEITNKSKSKKIDRTNYAEKFETCTYHLISSIEYAFDTKVTDLQLKGGYFIFDFGENSVVQFHIDKCPGWLFGIWWDTPKKGKEKTHAGVEFIEGEFFCQYEKIINKFKPSSSEIYVPFECSPEVTFVLNDCLSPSVFGKIIEQINFVKNEPYLAFCRCYCGWNYNVEYHTRSQAKTQFLKFEKWYETKELQKKILDDKVLSFFGTNVIPMFTDATIDDKGDEWSPRYELVAPLKSNKGVSNKIGCYDCFDDTKEHKKIRKELDKLIKECNKVADKFNFIWYPPIDATITLFNNKEKK